MGRECEAEEWRDELAEDDAVGDVGFARGNGERDLEGTGELRRDIDVSLSSTYKMETIQCVWEKGQKRLRAAYSHIE